MTDKTRKQSSPKALKKVKEPKAPEMFNLNSLEPDAELANNGVWLDFFDGSKLKIAQADNKAYNGFITQQYKAHRRKIDLENKASDKLSEDITLEAIARFVLKDWEGITFDGEDTPYSYKVGMEAMTKIPMLRKEVDDQSRRLQNFQVAEDEEDRENVKTTSPGS